MPRPLRLLLALTLACALDADAQPPRTAVQVTVVPDHADWTYHVGEVPRFEVSVLRQGHPVSGAVVRYEAGPELMPFTDRGPLALAEGRASVQAGTLRVPGFLRVRVVAEVDGQSVEGSGTAGFDPERIVPYAVMPPDFETYWRDAIATARRVPLASTMTLVPEQSSREVAVYHVSFQVDRAGSRMYGMLSMPTAPGRYPVVLQVPGAGVRPYSGSPWLASRGVIHLAIGVHGIPVNLPQPVYDALAAGALNGYQAYGVGSRDGYYYHRVVLGAVRAGDFLASLPQADSTRYGVFGSSQGGALSIIVAALDPRITALAAIHPAMSDHEAFLHGRAAGWPRLLSDWFPANRTPAVIETLRYYDVANFARLVRAPGWYSWGYNDDVVAPSSTYAAYNVIAAPKQLRVYPETAHWTYDEQWTRAAGFLLERFGIAR